MSKHWYFQVMGDEVGPVPSSELVRRARKGEIAPDTLVRMSDSTRWVPALRVKGLFGAALDGPAEPEHAAPPPAPPGASAAPAVDKPPESGFYSLSGVLEGGTSAEAPGPDSGATDPHHDPEFYDFVGFREAVSPALFDAVQEYRLRHGLTMTQLNRRALAEFIGRADLAEDHEPEPAAATTVPPPADFSE